MAVTSIFGAQVINSGTGASTYTSSAFTPTAGRLLLVFVKPQATRAAAVLTSSEGGQSFSLIATENYGASSAQYCYISDAVTTAASQTFTFDCTGDAASSCAAVYYEIDGSAFTGLAAILQSAQNSGVSGATPDVTFAGAVDTSNLTVIHFGHVTNANIGVPTGWTEDFDLGGISARQECAHRDSGFTGITITWTSTAGSVWAAFGVEFDGSAGGGGGATIPVFDHHYRMQRAA